LFSTAYSEAVMLWEFLSCEDVVRSAVLWESQTVYIKSSLEGIQ